MDEKQNGLQLNCPTLWQAITYINSLPYGRNSERDNYSLVLTEIRGTCSTKHAFIAALAEEHGFSLLLNMGLFEMNAENTPAISSTLKKYNLKSILEAHCYLRYEDSRIDITFPDKISYPSAEDFSHEFIIKPNQIGEYKLALHKKYMLKWIKDNNIFYDLDEMWKIREECISQLIQCY